MFYKLHTIPLFWWSTIKFHHKEYENFGDLVGPYLIKKITGKQVRFIHPKKRKMHELFTKVFVTAGSILAHVDTKSIVWGSGIIEAGTKVSKATFLAVRGPLTRAELLKQGCAVPEVYGDPAILLPLFYKPKVPTRHKVGIIPHYVDFEKVLKWYKNEDTIKVIDLLNDSVEEVIDEICKCETIISSSLHGIIVAHAYQIPVVWVKFSDKLYGDDIKFYDYFQSIGVSNSTPTILNTKLSLQECIKLIDQKNTIISFEIKEELQNGLIKVCPFI